MANSEIDGEAKDPAKDVTEPDTAPMLKQDHLVNQLSPEPDSSGPLTMLTGFLGKSPRPDSWRLYLTPKLDEFVEFSATDVHHVTPLSAAESALGGSRVWVRQGASLNHTQVNSRQVQAEFLSGSIAASNMASATRPALAARASVARRYARAFTYNVHVPACQTDGVGNCGGLITQDGCLTDAGGPLCGTGEFVCGPTAGCTYGPECGQMLTMALCTLSPVCNGV